MNRFAKITRNNLSYHTVKIFLLTKHQNPSFSTFTIQNPNANPNRETAPIPTKIHLVPTNHIAETPTKSVCQYQFGDVISSNKMISGYLRAGDLPSALQVFEKMSVKTTISWNSILSGYSKKFGNLKEAQRLFDKIPEPDTISYNTMLACYVHNSCMETAYSFFDGIPVKDVVSWNTMISGFAQIGMMDDARKLFSTMPMKNSVSWNAMITGYIEFGNLGYAEELFKVAPVKSVVAWTAMITGYMKFGMVDKAEKVFDEMPSKNLVTWNALIAGYVENGQPEDGMKVFKKMVECRIRPNPSSLCSVLLSCSNLCLYGRALAGTDDTALSAIKGAPESHHKRFLDRTTIWLPTVYIQSRATPLFLKRIITTWFVFHSALHKYISTSRVLLILHNGCFAAVARFLKK